MPATATGPAATEKQVAFIAKLCAERGISTPQPGYTKYEASAIIDSIMAMPRVNAPAAKPAAAPVEPGFYMKDGTVYKVQVSQSSGRPYAKVLNVATGSFEYVQGAVREISAEDAMTTEQAEAFGQFYGICAICSAVLTSETSIERGIGPICAAKIGAA